MYILGVGGFLHDYNCALLDLKTGRLAMCEAERRSRRKHHVILSENEIMPPIRAVCRDLGCRPRQIDTVVFGHTDPFPFTGWIERALGRRKRYLAVDHHLCHAAAAFFSSGLEDAAIVSVDGFGDGSSGLLALGSGNRIEALERISDDDSIGLEYTRATFHLGLGGYGAEGKTQGLAPYGEPTLFEDYMAEVDIEAGGNVRLGPRLAGGRDAFAVEGGYLNTQLLASPFLNAHCRRRIEPEPLTSRHMDVAASIQKVLEEVVTRLCLIARDRAGSRNLVLSGGGAMNSSLNGRLLSSRAFERVFPLPMASDRGIGLGAALYHAHHDLDAPRRPVLADVFFGGTFDDREMRRAMRGAGLRAERVADVAAVAADALARGRIVGWFQGRSEVGARALGHRSILADPREAGMKDLLNQRVKHREWFRPFAPAALATVANGYFSYPEGIADLSYMTFTVDATQHARDAVPAVVHVDGTARLQLVAGAGDGLFADVIRGFGEITGVPVVLNTSFNDRVEPIVETPDDAVKTFLGTDMDVLCMGNWMATKG